MIQQYDGCYPDPSPDTPVTCVKCDTKYTCPYSFSQHLLLHIKRDKCVVLLDRSEVRNYEKSSATSNSTPSLLERSEETEMNEEGETDMVQEEVEMKPKPFAIEPAPQGEAPKKDNETSAREEEASDSDDRMSVSSANISLNLPQMTIKADVHAPDDKPIENGRQTSPHLDNSPEGFKGFNLDSEEKPSEDSKFPLKPATPSLPNIAISVRKREDLMGQTNYNLIKVLTSASQQSALSQKNSQNSIQSQSSSASSIISNSQSSADPETSFTGVHNLGRYRFGQMGSQMSVGSVTSKTNPETYVPIERSILTSTGNMNFSDKEQRQEPTKSSILRKELCQVGTHSSAEQIQEPEGSFKPQSDFSSMSCQPQTQNGANNCPLPYYLSQSRSEHSEYEESPPRQRQYGGGLKDDQRQNSHNVLQNYGQQQFATVPSHITDSSRFIQTTSSSSVLEKPHDNRPGCVQHEMDDTHSGGFDKDCSQSSNLDGVLCITPDVAEAVHSSEEQHPQVQVSVGVATPTDISPKLPKNRKTIVDYFAPFKKPCSEQDAKEAPQQTKHGNGITSKPNPVSLCSQFDDASQTSYQVGFGNTLGNLNRDLADQLSTEDIPVLHDPDLGVLANVENSEEYKEMEPTDSQSSYSNGTNHYLNGSDGRLEVDNLKSNSALSLSQAYSGELNDNGVNQQKCSEGSKERSDYQDCSSGNMRNFVNISKSKEAVEELVWQNKPSTSFDSQYMRKSVGNINNSHLNSERPCAITSSQSALRPNLSVQRLTRNRNILLPASGQRIRAKGLQNSPDITKEPLPDLSVHCPSNKRLPQILTELGCRVKTPRQDAALSKYKQLSSTQDSTNSAQTLNGGCSQNSKNLGIPIDGFTSIGREMTESAPTKDLLEFCSEETSCSLDEAYPPLSSEGGKKMREGDPSVSHKINNFPTTLERQDAEALPNFNQAFPDANGKISEKYSPHVRSPINKEDPKLSKPLSVEQTSPSDRIQKESKMKRKPKNPMDDDDSDSSCTFEIKKQKATKLVDSPVKPLCPVKTDYVQLSPDRSYTDLDSFKEDFANGDFHNAQKELFRCALCPKTFPTSAELDAHTAADGHIICSMSDACAGLNFESSAALTHHQTMVHGAPTQTTAVQRLAAQVERLPQTFQGYPPVQPQPYNPPPQPYNSTFNGPKLGSQVVLTPMSIQPPPTPSLPNLPGIQVTKRPAAPVAEVVPTKIANRNDGLPNVRLPDSITLVKSQPAPPQNNVADMLATRGITMVASGSRSGGSATIQPVSPKRLPNVPSAISIVPSRTQPQQPQTQRFAVPPAPQRRVTNMGTVDLTKDDMNGRVRAGRPVPPNQRRFTCTFCDKVYPTAESLQAHMAIHGQKSGRFMCDVCRVVYTNEAKLAHHKRTVHPKVAEPTQNGPEFAIPIVDVNQIGVKEKLLQCGIRHIVQLSSLRNANDSATFGLPIIPIDLARNEAFSRLDDLGASNILTLGTLKSIYR